MKFYKENGYILLDNIFTPEEIDQCSQAYDDLFQLKKLQNFDMEATWGGSWSSQKVPGENKNSFQEHSVSRCKKLNSLI